VAHGEEEDTGKVSTLDRAVYANVHTENMEAERKNRAPITIKLLVHPMAGVFVRYPDDCMMTMVINLSG